jgi:1,4-alpha-glucan branching enzyme
VPLTKEAGHTDPADTLWAGAVPGTKTGDKYRYAIERGGATREFNDPRAQQLTGFDLPNGFGLPGNNDMPQSVIVDPNFDLPAFTEPTFNTTVIYEMHIGTFNKTFAGAVEKLDYLKALGINAVEVLPVTQNPLFSDHTPPDHDWGYDPVQLFAVKSKYGTPQDFKEFVKQCQTSGLAAPRPSPPGPTLPASPWLHNHAYRRASLNPSRLPLICRCQVDGAGLS